MVGIEDSAKVGQDTASKLSSPLSESPAVIVSRLSLWRWAVLAFL